MKIKITQNVQSKNYNLSNIDALKKCKIVQISNLMCSRNLFKEMEVKMNKAQPIKNEKDLMKFKGYYKEVEPNARNYLLIIIGLNTALRISDILELTCDSIYDFKNKKIRKYLILTEKKTGKISQIYINTSIKQALTEYMKAEETVFKQEQYLFTTKGRNNPISRTQAHRVIKKIVEYYNIEECISCHSLRKTFGYFAWKQGTLPALLVVLFNHSSYEITKCYLGIDQDDKDEVYKKIKL